MEKTNVKTTDKTKEKTNEKTKETTTEKANGKTNGKTKKKNNLTAITIIAFMIFLFVFTLYNVGVFDRQL